MGEGRGQEVGNGPRMWFGVKSTGKITRNGEMEELNGLKVAPGRFRLNIRRKRVVMHWHSCSGSGGVTIPGGVPELWRCGTEGCWAYWAW